MVERFLPKEEAAGSNPVSRSMKKVLVVGSGGREHALAWKLAQSKLVGEVFIAPGNPGTAEVGQNINIQPNEHNQLAVFVKSNDVALTVVGPDQPLADGLVDYFQKKDLRIFGPTKRAAQIEWSKKYAKDFMKKYGLPTAEYATFKDSATAITYIRTAHFPIVIKADGLALGKGVYICYNYEQAKSALKEVVKLPNQAVVIEEFLTGTEVSAHAICDGRNFVLFPLAQDHKRLGDGDTGPNTGGMGTICPVPEEIPGLPEIIDKILRALRKEGRPFTGCLFPGFMLTQQGPKILEFNARFGDPETQVFMRLINEDLYELLESATYGKLRTRNLEVTSDAAACIVLASEGYPGKYKKGDIIKGLEKPRPDTDSVIFHAGTAKSSDGIVTNGGRVLGVTATDHNLQGAVDNSYYSLKKIKFKGRQYRTDIGLHTL